MASTDIVFRQIHKTKCMIYMWSPWHFGCMWTPRVAKSTVQPRPMSILFWPGALSAKRPRALRQRSKQTCSILESRSFSFCRRIQLCCLYIKQTVAFAQVIGFEHQEKEKTSRSNEMFVQIFDISRLVFVLHLS